ncbi:hypothetical protein COLO4_04809 [Corchorus olitorius]|uniref:Protein kinase domain-containing protein n=1 Tax=Corchorus olitorius TaxID=93759 RepID=A0A1R3KSR5_9ROSI|nr:hypothetical protein COLO4_04809 [Corchorus olitorius]
MLSRKFSIRILVILFITLLLRTIAAKERKIQYDEFIDRDDPKLVLLGNHSTIESGALQLTPDSKNVAMLDLFHDKSGRIFYKESFRLWLENGTVASFNSYFVINNFREKDWTPGHGLAFLIAPNISIPENSYGQWLGLTNAATDGSLDNQIVAIEFDTNRQPFDPNDSHVGLDINSVISKANASLTDVNIILSTEEEAKYSVWVDYNGTSKLMEVFMVKEGEDKPSNPILSSTIDLKQFLKQDSYFGFSGSTGNPDIQLNCVLKWSLDIDILPRGQHKKWLKIGLGVGVPVATLLLAAIAIVVYRRRRKGSDEEADQFGKLKWLPGMPREFKYKELKKATNNFDESLKLGEGGFGIVYKGQLQFNENNNNNNNSSRNAGGNEVAVKKFSRDSIKSKDDFLAELAIIHRLRHRNLVRLVGWCYEKGKLLLVYDFMPNGSLDRHLYELGMAGVPGTMGYVAPECFHTGSATPESDVFGFGAVVLEVVCGRSPGIKIQHQDGLYTLVDWVWMLHREGRIIEAVDERLRNDFVVDEAKRLLLLGLACSHPIAGERPKTQDIVQIMNGTFPVPHVPPFKPVFQWPSGVSAAFSSTDNSHSSFAMSSQDSAGGRSVATTSKRNSIRP